MLKSTDVLVVGGGFAGVAAALVFASSGRRVALVEPRTYLGREISATLRPWVQLPPERGELWARLADRIGLPAGPSAGEIPLKMDALKLALEDLLQEAGVELLYASYAVGLCAGAERPHGLIIGNKSGRQAIAAGQIVDATEAASVARLAGGSLAAPAGGPVSYSRTIEFDGVGPLDYARLAVPPRLGLAGDRVALHCGYRGSEHVLVEYELSLPFEDGPWGFMRREIDARERGMALAAHLIAAVPAFAAATLAATSYELHGPQAGRLTGPRPGWVGEANASAGPAYPDLAGFAGPLPGLWCLNESAPGLAEHDKTPGDPVTAALMGESFARACIRWLNSRDGAAAPAGHATPAPAQPASPSMLEVRESKSPQRGRDYPLLPAGPWHIPVLDQSEVLVVGGGSSGATAAATAAREKAGVALVEMNMALGGTGTIGGVDSYWYGRHQVGFAARVSELTAEVHRALKHSRPKWNVEAKMHALLCEAEAAGVRTLFGAITIGTLVEGQRVRGVVAATRCGAFAMLAEVVVDATGDGDVAAFAGADYVYGSARDHTVMWFSLAQFATPGRTRNNFTSMADVSNVADYTRAILAGRRRGENVHDHGAYLAPRETRHVLGDVTITLTDQLLRRRWPDVVNVHYSNHDVKGPADSPWVRAGLIPPNLETEIPYRALLPRGLEGIIVTGKAISASHDGLPAIRMQADMENLGGVAGLAAALAVRSGKPPHRVDVAALQRRLVDAGLLPEAVLTRRVEPRRYTTRELRALVDSLSGDRPLYAYSDMEMGEIFDEQIPFVEICTAGPAILPLLEQALETAAGRRRVLLAQALAMYGAPAAVPVLIEEIERELAGDALPARESNIRHAGFPPDQGAMPDVVYLLNSLAMARDRRSLPIWARIADLLDAAEEDVRDRRKGTYYYVEALCSGAEQLGDPAAIPLLEKLYSYPPLRGQVLRSGIGPDFFKDRQAMLELSIAQALARCGGRDGLRILIDYLDDARALFAEHAHTELSAITGQDFGKNAGRWTAWLERPETIIEPRPLRISPRRHGGTEHGTRVHRGDAEGAEERVMGGG